MINVSRLYCGIENSSDRFRYKSGGETGPVVVYNCTNKCGQNCLHCYSRTGLNSAELDTIQAKKLLEQLAEIKCAVVLFSGGEPLERGDLFELLDYSRKLGLRTVLSTNGNLIDADVAGKLVSAGVNYVGVSIDGTEETHDGFRGIKGSFARAVAAIKFCKDAGLKTGLRFTITNHNFSQIGDVFALAAESGIARICFYHLISAGQAIKNDLKCTNQQIRDTLRDILNYAKEYCGKGVTEVLTVGNHADGAFILSCLKRENSPMYEKSYDLLKRFGGNKIGIKIFAVDACGDVHPDQFWRDFSLGNITKEKLADIFRKSLDIFKDKTGFAPAQCRDCEWLKICGTNARFSGKNYNSEGFLEPGCYI